MLPTPVKPTSRLKFRDWSLITRRGDGGGGGGGQVKFYPDKKNGGGGGGVDNFSAILFPPFKMFYAVLSGGRQKFLTLNFLVLSPTSPYLMTSPSG